MTPEILIELIKQYGFPIVAAVGMGYFVYFIYSFVTKELTPLIGQTNGISIMIDRIKGMKQKDGWDGIYRATSK